MDAEPRKIEITRGSAWSETWRHEDDEGSAADLTGCTGELRVSASAAAGVLATGTWTPAAAEGEAVLALTEEQVALMDGHRVLHWTLVITDAQGADHEARGTIYMTD